jgi:hypothetical protein
VRARALGAVALALALALAAAASAGDVVVLKGGERIELQSAPRQQGNNILLTRADGTLLSVPISEIDMKATAEARKAVRKPEPASEAVAQTPAEAARTGREGPKAKVRVTDADVAHETVQATADAPGGEKKDAAKGGARLDVVGYDQSRAGSNLIVRGSLRNVGGTRASNSRLSVTALDDSGEIIGTGEASLSKGTLDSYETVAFTASVPVGEKAVVATLRFQPQWVSAPPPAPPAEAAAAQRAAGTASQTPGQAPAAAANQLPAPAPTPYGFGLYYAPPIPPAAIGTPPADGKTGYIPAPSDPASQPKPPNGP